MLPQNDPKCDDSGARDNADLKFNWLLWKRFRQLAQVYFFPEKESGWEILVGGLVLAVCGFACWALLVIYLITSLLSLTPIAGVEKAAAMPNPVIAMAALTIAGVLFYHRRRHLAGRWYQWGLLACLLFLLLCVTGLNVYISFVFRGIDNEMVAKNASGFYGALSGFGMALVVAVPIIGLYRFVRQTLAMSWRGHLSEFLLDHYFAKRVYFKLDSNSDGAQIDNPDQRITQDVQYFTDETLQFLLDILGGLLDLMSFSAILWSTSKPLMGSLLAYSFVGTVIALMIGHRLVAINYEQLRKEADFRYGLVHIRDNAEAVAFYGGELLEAATIKRRLWALLANYKQLIHWSTMAVVYQRMFFYMARLVPYLVVGGLYFEGKVDFGTVGQATFAFSMVLSAVTLIVDRITEISRFAAGVNRLGAFYDEIKRAQAVDVDCTGSPGDVELSKFLGDDSSTRRTEIFTSVVPDATTLEMRNVTLQTPTGLTLIEGLNFAISADAAAVPGRSDPRHLLVVGPSGAGKSSVLRAISGLWTRGSGEVRRPPAGRLMFLPQKPYMPLGDLRLQLNYPDVHSTRRDEELDEMLRRFGLGALPSRFKGGFKAVQDWANVLSGGEQQRIAIARCLLSMADPVFVVLDEATSALPLNDEALIYKMLRERNIGYVSVGHRDSLYRYHDLVLEICGEGKWKLRNASDNA